MSSPQDGKKAALNTAANVLQYRNRSRQALLDRLLEKGIEEEDALYAVTRLEELGYLNDAEYARSVAESLKNRGYGKQRVRHELRRKKLEPEMVDQALEEYETDGDALETFIAKKLGAGAADRKAIKRVSDALIRRGFSWDEVNRAMREYTSGIEDEIED